MTTPMHPVQSSQVSYIGYEESTKELFVTFKDGHTYKYQEIPKQLYENLMKSDSIGRFLSMYIKGIYAVTKIN